jgi:hypothetical protein
MHPLSRPDLVTETSPSTSKSWCILLSMLPVPRATVTRRALSALLFALLPAACAATGDATDLGLPGQTGRETLWPDGGAPQGTDPTSGGDDGSAAEGSTSSSSSSESGTPTSSGDSGSSSAKCGAWGDCAYTDVCATNGIQVRSCTESVCEGGACHPETVMEMQACTRMTDGVSCGARTCPAFGACNYTDVCDTSATQTRTCTDHVCAAGKCTDKAAAPDTQNCSRSTGGIQCSGDTYSQYGGCQYANNCSTSGTRYRTRYYHDCGNSICGSTAYSDSTTAGCDRSRVCQPGQTQGCTVYYPTCPVNCGGSPDCYHTGSQSCAADCSGWNACVNAAGGWLC